MAQIIRFSAQSAFTTHLLICHINGMTQTTGFEELWLAERAKRRALGNGASFAYVETR